MLIANIVMIDQKLFIYSLIIIHYVILGHLNGNDIVKLWLFKKARLGADM